MNLQADKILLPNYSQITVLGAGFIGMNFIRVALNCGYHLKVLDHNFCPKELNGKLKWIKGDISNEIDLREALLNSDIVFHFLSSTVPGDLVNEGQELKQNVFHILQLLKLCVQEKVNRFVFVSSSSVYGLQDKLPISESAPTEPISSHGIQKLIIEKYMLLYQFHHGLDCKIVRLSNPYGPGQKINGRQGFIAIAIGKIMSRKPILIHGNGSIVRDFIYIKDVVETLLEFIDNSSREYLFNVGSGSGYALNDVIQYLRELTSLPVEVMYGESRFVDIPNSVLDISRKIKILGKTEITPLKTGLALTLENLGVPLSATALAILNLKKNAVSRTNN